MMQAVLATALGAFVMSDTQTATADDKKKAEPKIPDLKTKDSFTEKLTLREKVSDPTVVFGPQVKDVPAVYGEVEGKKVVWVITPSCPKGSELTDQKTGDVFTVETTSRGRSNFAYHVCYISPKKKP
jgi:hypothetical protein